MQHPDLHNGYALFIVVNLNRHPRNKHSTFNQKKVFFSYFKSPVVNKK